MDLINPVEHPDVIKLFCIVETIENIYTVRKNVNGGQQLHHIPEATACRRRKPRVSRQIMSPVRYCHKKSIMHRELTLENILDAGGNIRLSFQLQLGWQVHGWAESGQFCSTPHPKLPQISTAGRI
ncbi:Hypothetical predicted protein [Marmota monax]|uniref:non-specific serine/threonine protein kinase n=1 Tax=Marmota monax TaxID=9995 RepID=A0A5E4CSR8_MARMO|nr:hypothetical protein GHT09_011419 [Marmota monax]VTJ83992.1 Hypothetical predicted protein [Marmota monax]